MSTQQQNPTATRRSDDLSQHLEQLDIEICYHDLISHLCGGKQDYLKDILESDIEGRADANGDTIPAAVARGLIRKLRSSPLPSVGAGGAGSLGQQATSRDETKVHRGHDDNIDASSTTVSAQRAVVVRPCSVSLRRGDAEYSSIVRCTVRGQIREQDNYDNDNWRRKRILTAVLDNSYSMSGQWSLVVNAISRVFTGELLKDESISLNAIVYNTDATEVKLPGTTSELSSVLLNKFRPTGITNFKSAFELAESVIRREINELAAGGGGSVSRSYIDVTTLLFTDGQDTSVAPLGYTSPGATAKARAAGDAFRKFLDDLGCPAYTCIAAFGEHHNPEQCQYLSDRYYYINREEVLSDWLSSGLAELVQSSGYCSFNVQVPPGLSLAEPLPKRIGLDSGGNVEYEIWFLLNQEISDSTKPDAGGKNDEVTVTVNGGEGNVDLHGSSPLSTATIINQDGLEGRLFLMDAGEMQLRQIARELRGQRPSASELARLRERLIGVKELVQPIVDVANDPKARISGRALLRSRLDELELRRNRLSYALGHFEEEDQDTRTIGSVGIDAILRDASQLVPLGAKAVRYARRAEAAAVLQKVEELSDYGNRCTYDALSGCNAKQAADQGDAMFFRLRHVSFSDDGGIQSAVDSGDQPVAYEIFMLLSNDGESPVNENNKEESFTHLGLPFFATAGHFSRAKLMIPEVLKRLSPSGTFQRGKSERLMLSLLGHALASQLTGMHTSLEGNLSLFHKARSVSAAFKSTKTENGRTLYDEVLREAKSFIDNPEERRHTRNLYEIAAIALIAEEWPSNAVANLGEAVIEESIRRAATRSLEGATESKRLKMAWSIVGGGRNDHWLDCSLTASEKKCWDTDFNILTAASELEDLEANSPGEYSPRTPELLSHILGTTPPDGTPTITDWSRLRKLIARWSAVVEEQRENGGLWQFLDALMVDHEGAPHEEELARLSEVKPDPLPTTLRDILINPMSTLTNLVAQCMHGMSKGKQRETDDASCVSQPRLVVASAIGSIVKGREKFARKYPIRGASYPCSRPISEAKKREMWGAPASPVDEKLYNEVRRRVHRKYSSKQLTVREALTEKVYRKEGGGFAFPTPLDTFIPGLHKRTKDLRCAWLEKKKETKGPQARDEAVNEMLLRLRWDDRDEHARAVLSKIVATIWDGLEGLPPGRSIPSALWLDDDSENDASRLETSDASSMREEGKQKTSNEVNIDEWDVL